MNTRQFFARVICALPLLLAPVPASAGPTATAEDNSIPIAYVFTHFTGNGADGLHLAASKDGYQWEVLNGGRSYLKPVVGQSKLTRDPCVLLGPDGTFHLVWTSASAGKTIGYEGPFTDLSALFTPDWLEGPTALQVG